MTGRVKAAVVCTCMLFTGLATGVDRTRIEALGGGVVDLGVLDEIIVQGGNPVEVVAEGAGSQVLLTGLTHFQGNVDNQGSYLQALDGATIQLNAATTELGNGVELRLRDSGTIEVGQLNLGYGAMLSGMGQLAADVENGGRVAPGVDSAQTDRITLNGTYTQKAAGSLQIHMQGAQPATDYDQVLINGTANLAGAVELLLDPAYTPVAGSRLPIVQATERLGGFSSASGLLIHSGGQLSLDYGPTDAALLAAGPGFVDGTGPSLTNPTFSAAPLQNEDIISAIGELAVDASDPSGMGRVDFELDGLVFASDSNGADGFSGTFNPADFIDGTHQLRMLAYDVLNNPASLAIQLTIDLAAPPQPNLQLPLDGLVSNLAQVQVSGSGQPGAAAQLYVDSVAQTGTLAINSAGGFYGSAILHDGANQLQASALNRGGESPLSAAISVTYDSSIPAAPEGLQAQALEGGVIRLDWSAPGTSGISGYHVYRANQPFIDIADAVRINTSLLTESNFDDLPTPDGDYYYRAVSVNEAGSASPTSVQAQATADSMPPKALAVTFIPGGAHDPVTGVVGVGTLDIRVEVDEPLLTDPFVSLAPVSGAPISIPMTVVSGQIYHGSAEILQTTPSGTALVVFSARDPVGNRGSEIVSGGSLDIDTDGPLATGVTLTPGDPVNNDPLFPSSLQIAFGLNEPPKPGTAPAMQWQLSQAGRVSQPLTLVDDGSGVWSGSLTLPADAGETDPETLSFQLQVVDALDNPAAQTLPSRQVYQGGLPPLGIPEGLAANARPAGRVALSWNSVTDAVDYQLYRGDGDSGALVLLARSAGALQYDDQTPADGIYRYAVASVRSANGQEGLSAQSAEVQVSSDSVLPAAPTGLTLELLPVGIDASWQAPEGGESLVYNLYRDSGPTLDVITGLIPVVAATGDLYALDALPDPLLPVYAVTAVDAAGNESSPSGWAFLNVDLYPVQTLSVVQQNQAFPRVSWSHDGAAVAGYHVYLGEEPDWFKLTDQPITQAEYPDTGFNGGQRLYSVVAVDANAAESLARSIFLPDLQLNLVGGSPVMRGLMSRLDYQVSNSGANGVMGIVVHAELDGRDHQSAAFDLGPGEMRQIPVIVGGYSDLPAVATLTSSIEITPNPGEQVRIISDGTIDVADAALGLQLRARELTRGGSGQVRFVLDNTSPVELALVTASANGSADSPDLRLSLLDPDENLLSTVALRQAFGSGVETLPDGRSVVRIAAGGSFESDWFNLPVPAAAPDAVTIELMLQQLHYHPGQADAVAIDGGRARLAATLVDTAYSGALLGIAPLSSYGDEAVVIKGQAISQTDGQPVAFVALKLVIAIAGYERYFEVETGALGEFSFAYSPLPHESGVYRVSVVHPDVLERPEQGEFSVGRLFAQPDRYRVHVPYNYDASLDLRLSAGVGTSASNAQLLYLAEDQPLGELATGIDITLPAAVDLQGGAFADVVVGMRASQGAPDTGTLFLRLVSDEGGLVSRQQVRVDYAFSAAQPSLFHSPGYVEMGGIPGEQAFAQLTLRNQGLAALLEVELSVHAPAGGQVPDWFALGGMASLGDLDVGQTTTVELVITPGATVADGLYEFILRASAGNHATVDIPVYVSVTQAGEGNVLFHVSDIYTATLDEQGNPLQGLAGARIELQNEQVPTVLESDLTDAAGEALFSALPAGRYRYRVSAADHRELGGVVQITPGITASEEAFLDFNLVTVEWSVTEITLEDRYEVIVNTVFHTDVPAAVVVTEPTRIRIPAMAIGEVAYGELTITNYGLVRAENVALSLPPDNAFYRFEFLAGVPDSIDAKQRLVVPYRISKLGDPLSVGDGQASGGGCEDLVTCTMLKYQYTCANGKTKSGQVKSCFVADGPSNCASGVNSESFSSGDNSSFNPGSISFDCEDDEADPDDPDPPPVGGKCPSCRKKVKVLSKYLCKVDPNQNQKSCDPNPGRECLVCVDGDCKQPNSACGAKKNPGPKVTVISSPGLINSVIDTLTSAISLAPMVQVSFSPSYEGTLQPGEECCNDCSTEPATYTDGEGSVSIKGTLTATTPSRPKISLSLLRYYRVIGAVGIGLQGTIELSGSGKFLMHDSSCDANDCTTASVEVGASGKIALVGSGTLAFQQLDLVCVMQGGGTKKREDCYSNILGVAAELEGAVQTGVKGSVGTKLSETEFCKGNECKVSINNLEQTATVKFEAAVPGFPKLPYALALPPRILSKGETYDCSHMVQ